MIVIVRYELSELTNAFFARWDLLIDKKKDLINGMTVEQYKAEMHLNMTSQFGGKKIW